MKSAPAGSETWTPSSQEELRGLLVENACGERRTVQPQGGGTNRGAVVRTEAQSLLDTTGLDRVVDFPARDLTVTVEAGMRVATLQERLAAEGARLPLDVALPDEATLGGAVAASARGPRAFGHGTFRDALIGLSAVDAGGRAFRAGGRVVKNVAGYDLGKLLVGSHGTLAVLTQLSFKLRPLPASSAFVWASCSDLENTDRALAKLLQSSARPVAIEVLCCGAAATLAARCPVPSGDCLLGIGIEGTEESCRWQVAAIREELRNTGAIEAELWKGGRVEDLYRALTELHLDARAPWVFRAVLLPSRLPSFLLEAHDEGWAVRAGAGHGEVIGWRGDDEPADRTVRRLRDLRAAARAAAGSLLVLRSPWSGLHESELAGETVPAAARMQSIKEVFDPHRLLSPGRRPDGGWA